MDTEIKACRLRKAKFFGIMGPIRNAIPKTLFEQIVAIRPRDAREGKEGNKEAVRKLANWLIIEDLRSIIKSRRCPEHETFIRMWRLINSVVFHLNMNCRHMSSFVLCILVICTSGSVKLNKVGEMKTSNRESEPDRPSHSTCNVTILDQIAGVHSQRASEFWRNLLATLMDAQRKLSCNGS